MQYYCIAPNGRKSYVPEWLYEKRRRSNQHEVGVEDSSPASADYPKAKGGGWYELSDGSSVQGKDQAIEAENNL